MNWQERFYSFIAEYLRFECKLDVKKVTDVREYSYDIGFCPTCSDVEYEIDIDYVDLHDANRIYNLKTKLADLFS